MGIEGYKFVWTYAAYAHMCLFLFMLSVTNRSSNRKGLFDYIHKNLT